MPCSAPTCSLPIPTRKRAASLPRSSNPSSISGAGHRDRAPPPIDDIDTYWAPAEKAMVERSLAVSFVGSPATVQRGLAAFIESARPDELMITAHVHDQPARLRSIGLVSEVREN